MQENQYLWLSNSGLFRPAPADGISTNAYFTLEEEHGVLTIRLRGTEDNRYLGWDSDNKKIIGSQTKDNAIKVRIYGP